MLTWGLFSFIFIYFNFLSSVSHIFQGINLSPLWINLLNILGFPGSTSGKEPPCQCRRLKRSRFDPWGGKISPGEGNGYPLQLTCMKNPMHRGAWRAAVHRVANSQTWLKWLSTHAHKYFILFFVILNGIVFFIFQVVCC